MSQRIALVVAVVVALVVIGFLVQRAVFAPTAPVSSSTPSAAASASVPTKAVVAKVSGTAERRGQSGGWLPLAVGDEVALSDVIRTGPDSSAEIALGDTVTVLAADKTSFTVAEVSKSLSRVQLDDGRISTNVRGADGFRFRVQVRGSDAEAETEAGEFAVIRRGEGPVAVAAKSGRVKLSAADGSVDIGAGEQSIVEPGKAPTPPSEIPASLFLKLGKPPPVAGAATETLVDGVTVPGAIVSVGGVAIPVKSDGTFEGSVALADGANDIVVVVEDVMGRQVHGAVAIARAPKKAPPVAGSVQW